MDNNIKTYPALACELNALSNIQRVQLGEFHRELLPLAISIDETVAGYDLRFKYTETSFIQAAEYITLERLCCPFLNMALLIEQNDQAFLIRISGEPSIKAFVRAELGLRE